MQPRLADIAQECGYEMVPTSAPTTITSETDPMAFGRFGVGPDDWNIEFRLKALGAYAWRRWLPRHRRRSSRMPRRPKSWVESLRMGTEGVQRGY